MPCQDLEGESNSQGEVRSLLHFKMTDIFGESSHTMLQHDHRGRPIFVHANLLKQIPSGIGKG